MTLDFPLTYLPPPPGLNYIAAVEPCYTFVLISLPLSAILVPILLLILFFSTPSSRRTLLFAVNVLIVLLGIVEGILSTTVQSLIILHPQELVSDRLFITYITFAFCTPIIVDCVLILRLSAVYPATITPRTTRLAILIVPLLCTAARFACVSVFVRGWALSGTRSSALLAGTTVWPQNPMIIADWSLQLFENMYCSALFLFRLRGHKAFSSRMYRNQTISARLHALFYIAVSNFVFPTILSIVQLTYVICDPSVVHGATVLMVNNYVSIIGVLFCTLWCSSDIWKGTHNIAPFLGPDNAAYPQSIITLSGIAPNLHFGPPEPRPPQSYRTHATSQSLSLGQRPHPFANTAPPFRQADHKGLAAPRTSKEYDSADFLQPIALPRMMVPVHADAGESDIESPSRSPITPCDGGTDGACRDWIETRASRCSRAEAHDDEMGPATGISETDTDFDFEIAFATPTPPPSDVLWQHRRRHSLSVSVNTAEPFDPFPYVHNSARRPTASASEDDHRQRPFAHAGHPSLSRAQRASFLDWSDSEPPGRTRTPSWDGRSLQR